MARTEQGLTKTYNQLKDPECTDAPIEHLRRLHEAMDRAVLDAYGWTDIVVPAYGTPTTAEERRALERFEDEVIDRLFALNAVRAAEEERLLGASKSKGRAVAAAAAEVDGADDAADADDATTSATDDRGSARRVRAAAKAATPRHRGPGLHKSVPPPPPGAREEGRVAARAAPPRRPGPGLRKSVPPPPEPTGRKAAGHGRKR